MTLNDLPEGALFTLYRSGRKYIKRQRLMRKEKKTRRFIVEPINPVFKISAYPYSLNEQCEVSYNDMVLP